MSLYLTENARRQPCLTPVKPSGLEPILAQSCNTVVAFNKMGLQWALHHQQSVSNTLLLLCSLDLQCSFPLGRLDGVALQTLYEIFIIHIECHSPSGLMDRCCGMRPVSHLCSPAKYVTNSWVVNAKQTTDIWLWILYPGLFCFLHNSLCWVICPMPLSCSHCWMISFWIASYCFGFSYHFNFWFTLWSKYLFACFSLIPKKNISKNNIPIIPHQ